MTNIPDQFKVETEGNSRVIHLGQWHGFDADLIRLVDHTRLCVGCRTFDNAAAARYYWRNGSNWNHEPRPYAELLITLAEALCQREGWTDWLASNASGLVLATAERDATIAQLNKTIARLNTIIAEQSSAAEPIAIVEMRREISSLTITVADRDRTIRDLNERIGLQQGTIELQRTVIRDNLRAQADESPAPPHIADPTPLDFQRLFERVLALEHDVETQSTTILNLHAQAGHLSKDHTPPINVTVPMLQHLSDRVAELERNLEAMKGKDNA